MTLVVREVVNLSTSSICACPYSQESHGGGGGGEVLLVRCYKPGRTFWGALTSEAYVTQRV